MRLFTKSAGIESEEIEIDDIEVDESELKEDQNQIESTITVCDDAMKSCDDFEDEVDDIEEDDDMSDEEKEVALNSAVENFAGRVFKVRASEMYRTLGIESFTIDKYTFGNLDDKSDNKKEEDNKEKKNNGPKQMGFFEEIKERLLRVWDRIKTILQSLIQWIGKWVHKALVWLKGFDKKAESLKKEAEKLDTSKPFNFEGKFSPMTLALFGAQNKMSPAEYINSTIKANGQLNTEFSRLIKRLHSDITGALSAGARELSENDKLAFRSDSHSEYMKNKPLKPIPGTELFNEAAKIMNINDTLEKEFEQMAQSQNKLNREVISKILKNEHKSASAIGFDSLHKFSYMVYDADYVDNYNKVLKASVEEKKEKHFNIEFKTDGLESDLFKDGFKQNMKSELAKKEILDACSAIKPAVNSIQEMLSKGNSEANKIRNEIVHWQNKLSGVMVVGSIQRLIVKMAMAYSKLTYKTMVCTAYLPGLILQVSNELLNGVKGTSSGSSDKKEDNK